MVSRVLNYGFVFKTNIFEYITFETNIYKDVNILMDAKYQINYHIIPFAFQLPYIQAVQILKTNISNNDNKTNIWSAKLFNDSQRIFSHINGLIETENPVNNTIGSGFVLTEAARKEYDFSANKNGAFIFKSKDFSFNFYINEVELYIFETQIGFVCLKVDIKRNIADEIIEGNYFVKNLYQNKEKFFMEKFINGGKQLVNSPIHLSIKKMLEFLNVNTYFENHDKFPKQTLVYNALCLNEKPEVEEIPKYIYKMKRLFKDSYKISDRDLCIDNCKDTIQLFENSYWGISLEGFANFTYLVDDEITNSFLTSNYKGTLDKTYYYIYLVSLHQRYALLNFSMKASGVKKLNSCDDVDENIINYLTDLKHDISYFYLRANYNNISNITHQSVLYDLLRSNLRIEDLMNEISSELDGVKNILEERKNKRKEEEAKEVERKKDLFNIFIAIISIVFVVLQTTNSIWDMFNKGYTGQYPLFTSNTFKIFIATVLITISGSVFAMIAYAYRLIKNKSKKKN